MDGRKNNRGHKGKAGRKPKAEEQKLVEKLSPLEPLAFTALQNGLEDNQSWAVKLFFEYMFGKPKETIEHMGNGLNIQLSEMLKFDNPQR